MNVYRPGKDTDRLVLQWYEDMGTIDALKNGGPNDNDRQAFLTDMLNCLMGYNADDCGIWSAAWFDAVMDGAIHHAWIREDYLGTEAAREALIEGLAFGLTRFAVLLAVTPDDPSLLAEYRSLGFVPLGAIPQLSDGEAVVISWVTRDRLFAALGDADAKHNGGRH